MSRSVMINIEDSPKCFVYSNEQRVLHVEQDIEVLYTTWRSVEIEPLVYHMYYDDYIDLQEEELLPQSLDNIDLSFCIDHTDYYDKLFTLKYTNDYDKVHENR